jgi:hypothetical protein
MFKRQKNVKSTTPGYFFKPLTFAAYPSPTILVADYTFNANILIDVRMNLVQSNLSEK